MKKINLLKFAGAAAAAVYIVMTLISHLHNPGMGLFGNWLSDYGSPTINPGGAIFYNLGCIIAALLLAAFYIGMISWHKGSPRKIVICYICAEISGLAAAVFLILASLMPIGTSELHKTFSLLNMIGIDCFLVFTAIAAFMHPYAGSGLGVLGLTAAAFNIFTMNVLGNFFIAEWIFFALFIVYIIMLTYNHERFSCAVNAPEETAVKM